MRFGSVTLHAQVLAGRKPSRFNLLDLPEDVVLLIARFTAVRPARVYVYRPFWAYPHGLARLMTTCKSLLAYKCTVAVTAIVDWDVTLTKHEDGNWRTKWHHGYDTNARGVFMRHKSRNNVNGWHAEQKWKRIMDRVRANNANLMLSK